MEKRIEFFDTKTRKVVLQKWEIRGYENYCFAANKRCYNRITGFEVKLSLVGYTKGYYLHGKFVSLKKLKELLYK